MTHQIFIYARTTTFMIFVKLKKFLVKNFYCLDEKGNEINNKFLINLLTYQVIFCVSKK